jgi:hypothetical protein
VRSFGVAEKQEGEGVEKVVVRDRVGVRFYEAQDKQEAL